MTAENFNKMALIDNIRVIPLKANIPNAKHDKPQYIYLLFVWFGGMLLGLFIIIKKISKKFH